MKQKIFRLLVPESIQKKLSQMYAQQSQLEQYLKRKEFEESLPVAELSSVYIEHLRVVANINELFNCLPKGATVVEIGVGNGELAYKILAITKPQKLTLIDTWAEAYPGAIDVHVIENKFGAEIRSGQVEIHQGRSISGLDKIEEKSVDWVYLSTDKTYERTASLLEVCQGKVKREGIIAGSNYAVGDWLTSQRYGVIESVNEFCKKHGWEIVYLTHERDRNLSYAIKEIASNPP